MVALLKLVDLLMGLEKSYGMDVAKNVITFVQFETFYRNKCS